MSVVGFEPRVGVTTCHQKCLKRKLLETKAIFHSQNIVCVYSIYSVCRICEVLTHPPRWLVMRARRRQADAKHDARSGTSSSSSRLSSHT